MTAVLDEELPVVSPPPRRRRSRWRGVLVALGAILAVFLLAVGCSLVAAWRTPGNEDFKAKWADWLRSHDMAFIVNPAEQWYYAHDAPPKGGRPEHLNAVPGDGQHAVVAAKGTARGHLAPPVPVSLVVSPALPGEGRWIPTGPSVDGGPGMYIAQFRADQIYTSQITTAVWMDPTRLRINLIPGAHEPGGSWPQPPYIARADLPRAVAAFNGGFRFQDAKGGFFLDGRVAVPLREGAASIALYRDGHVNIGTWGRDFGTAPDLQGVLQNLVLLVDHGRVARSASYADHLIWGDTLGENVVVARSGIGITADGALVYVAGPALTVRTLAEALQRVGAVRAMALDLNPEWVTCNLYQHPDPQSPATIDATRLYPQIQRPATRYLPPVYESRDFFEVLAR